MKARNGGLLFLLSLSLLLSLTPVVRAERAAYDAADCQVIVNPGESIDAAVDAAPDNTTICVRGGVYNEQVIVNNTRVGIKLLAYPGEVPIIDGMKRLPGGFPSHRFEALIEFNGQNLVLDGFEIRFSSARGLDINGDDIIVRNVSVHDNWDTGINVRGFDTNYASNVLVENSQVYSNLRKARHMPVIYRGDRVGTGPADWLFDPDVYWDNPFWSGKETDMSDGELGAISLTFNDDGRTSRVYVISKRNDNGNNDGHISEEFSASGQRIDYSGRDLLFYDPATGKWTHFFNGQQLAGLTASTIIDAFQIDGSIPIESLPCSQCAPIVMSFSADTTVNIGGTPTTIGPADLVRFSPTEVSAANVITAGAFTLERTAAEMGLPAGANIDALDRTPDGSQLMSFTANIELDADPLNELQRHEDLFQYGGPGVWTLYFDGSAVEFNPFSQDLTAVWLDRNGHIYISGDPVGGSALTFVVAENATSRGNRIYNNYGEGLVAGRFSRNITLEDNVAYDNDHANVYLNNTINPLVQRNLIYCTDDHEFWRKGNAIEYRPGTGLVMRDEDFTNMPPPSSGQVIINNIVIGCNTNFDVSTQREGGGLNNGLVANNTFVNSRADAVGAVENVLLGTNAVFVNSKFVNNLIVQTLPGRLTRIQGGHDFSTFTVANNLYTATPDGWFPGEAGRVIGNPQFVNGLPPLPTEGNVPNVADFALAYGSPAFDAGQAAAEVTADFFGGTRAGTGLPDIGAHELPYVGEINIIQQTMPQAGPAHEFNASYPPYTFQLDDGQKFDSGVVAAGTHSVSAVPVPGWAAAGTCDDGSPPDAIVVSPGETVTCTFTATQETTLTVVNVVEPAAGAPLFDFSLSPGEAFQLGHDSRTFVVAPGTSYALSATTPAGWERSGASCDNGAPLDAILLDLGDAVTCTFTHRPQGSIVVVKQTLPDGAAQAFAFTADYDSDGFSLSDGQQQATNYLTPGNYSVAETLPPGWAQTAATCDDGSTPDDIALGAGETVTCTFTNARLLLAMTLTPTPDTVEWPGGDVAFAVHLSNDGAADLTLTALSDSVFGDVADEDNDALVSTTCALPQSLAPGGSYDCTFTAHVDGETGAHQNTLTATATGPGGAAAGASDEAEVTIAEAPPGHIIVVKQTDPPNSPGSFAFTASYGSGSFNLAHGQSNDSGPLPSGVTYSVSETVPAGWTLANAVCAGDDDGNSPASIVLDPNETVTCTFTNRRVTTGPADVIYLTAAATGTVGGVAYTKGDIVAYDGLTGVWSLYFDGSDVGWTKPIGDFELLEDGSLLLTTSARLTLGAGGAAFQLNVQDIARFVPNSLGDITAGSFSLYFDGSDVGLGTAGERIDALARRADGTLLISTADRAAVKSGATNLTAQDEDLLAFVPTTLGSNTTGNWLLLSQGFDGSTLTGMAAEDVSGAWVDPANGDLYLTVLNAFTVGGQSGTAKTILKVTPARAVSVYWHANTAGYPSPIDGLEIVRR